MAADRERRGLPTVARRAEDLEIERLDARQNLRVQRQRRRDARTRRRDQHLDTRAGLLVDRPGDRVLLGQRPARTRSVGAPVCLAPGEQVAVDAVGGEFVGGQVDAAAAQVLVDVADEIGQLERLSERGGIRRRVLAGADGAQDGQQLQPDHLGRAVHVALQRRPVRVVGDRQVHPHRRPGSRRTDPTPMSYVRAVCTTAVSDGSSSHGRFPTRLLNSRVDNCWSWSAALLDAAGAVEVVEDVVGAAGEPVQRVHRRALAGRQQPGGQEERLAVLGVDRPALPVGLAQ